MQRWTRLAFCILCLVLLLGLAGAGAAQEKKPYIGNKNSKKYHTQECVWAGKISPKNRVEFRSVEEAEKAGYIPCKVCKPHEKRN
jgi:micrococcal nuclease